MNSVCKMFNMSYTNIINKRLYDALKQTNINFTKIEFDKLKDKDMNYIVNKFVNRQYKDLDVRDIIVNNINNKLYQLESYQSKNINPVLVVKHRNELQNIKCINRKSYSTYSNSHMRIIDHYKEKMYDNPYCLYSIKDIDLFDAIMKSTLCVQDYEYINKQNNTREEIIDYFVNREHEHIEVRRMIKNKIKNDIELV